MIFSEKTGNRLHFSAVASSQQQGFTLMELVMVLAVLAIISSYISPRSIDMQTTVQGSGFFHEMVTAVRYAQKLAATGGCEVQVSIDTIQESYALYYPDDLDLDPTTCDGATAGFGANPVTWINGSDYTATADNGIVIDGLSLTFYFDKNGKPWTTSNTPLTEPAMVGVKEQSLIVEQETGWVHIGYQLHTVLSTALWDVDNWDGASAVWQ
jgi:prepilin-type N-terminal cleavage/methylation domain-containing protein